MINPRRALNRWLNRAVFYNQRIEPLIWRLYYEPNPFSPAVPISDEARAYLATFRRDGLVVMPGRFSELAKYLEANYFTYLEGRTSQRPAGFISQLDLGTRSTANGTLNATISFQDPLLAPVLFDSDLCGLLYCYYRRQPYYREQPRLVVNAPSSEYRPDLEVSTKFHLDYYRQISFMLLVNDVTEADSHLEYAIGSHLEPGKPWDRYSYSDQDVVARYPIVKCHGPQGTLIIFESGSGFHRAHFAPNTVRKTLQTVITTGHFATLDERVDSAREWSAISSYPAHVRRMMDKLLLR